MALQIRRGLDRYRTSYIPAEGELVYITDTKKLYVGDGYTPGGILITGTLSSLPPPPTTEAPPPPTTTPPITTPPTTTQPTTRPPATTTEPPWTQEETITLSISSLKIRQSFQVSVSHGKPNSTFTYKRQGTDNATTATLSSSGSSILDFTGIDTAGTYTFDVHFNASGHDKPFEITIVDYDEKVDFSPAPVYENQIFNFTFTECEPGSTVSLERSSDSVDYSLIGTLTGTVDASGNLTVSYSETVGYWYYRFTFDTTTHTKNLELSVYSYSSDGGTGGDGGGGSE
jgi:hypothetical protein